MFSRCQYLLKNPAAAEDAMQDVFAKAIRYESTFRAEASPLTWLLKIATHHCLNQVRSDKAAWKKEFTQHELVRGDAHGGPMALEARDLVRRTLSKFDPETQAAVVHYYVDEMTLEEVAQLLERSVPTIRKRLKAYADATGQEMRDS